MRIINRNRRRPGEPEPAVHLARACKLPTSSERFCRSARPHPSSRGRRRPFPKERWHAQWDEFCRRSEEHTSELQSLMRISYAVFCLKKKKTKSSKITKLTITSN